MRLLQSQQPQWKLGCPVLVAHKNLSGQKKKEATNEKMEGKKNEGQRD
jgi:hypothetical protein